MTPASVGLRASQHAFQIPLARVTINALFRRHGDWSVILEPVARLDEAAHPWAQSARIEVVDDEQGCCVVDQQFVQAGHGRVARLGRERLTHNLDLRSTAGLLYQPQFTPFGGDRALS